MSMEPTRKCECGDVLEALLSAAGAEPRERKAGSALSGLTAFIKASAHTP